MRTLRYGLVGLGLLLTTATEARETDWVLRPQRKAEAKALEEDFLASAKLYAEALARAHKNKCPYAEQLLYRSMRKHLKPLWKWGAGPDGAGSGGLRKALHAMMTRLDGERSGAFVSAHALAGQLILRATWAGDGKYVDDAGEVLDEHADEDDVGKCAAVMDRYAEAMVAIDGGNHGRGASTLEKVLDRMVDERWTDLAIFAGTELAAAHLELGRKDRATAALDKIASSYDPKNGDIAIPVVWQSIVKKRLKGAPKSVLAPFKKVMATHEKRGAAHPPEGTGEPGKHGGKDRTSLLGRVLAKYSRKRPLMQAERTSRGFELRQRFDKRFEATFPYVPGVRHKGNQGLTLAFFGYSVALGKFDPTGLRDDPDPQIWPEPWAAFYHLGKDEIYSLNKRGVVSIEED